nr:MAG TPA: hypothetical protein [Crassvirales sp.]
MVSKLTKRLLQKENMLVELITFVMLTLIVNMQVVNELLIVTK